MLCKVQLNLSALVVVLAGLVATALARPDIPPVLGYGHPRPYTPEPLGPARYDFNYAVKDDYNGNDFGHQESRDGYNTQGSYYVLLPDGRLQRVTYYVDGDSGYVPQIEYEGVAQYPAYQPSPSYQPTPSYG
ncbi:cuticle protein 19-like [Homarus americanus]|uniref:cuticle protein 19-like n=1 Tax=Homarus americanus TaxID=6706 RepID=UPI001C49606D|nr:cuticle protein 19-like [Homarus americanus]